MVEYFKALRSYVGQYVSNFKVLVGLNQIYGVERVRKYGSNDNTTQTDRELLDFYSNDTKTYQGWYEVNTKIYLISSSVADSSQTITVYGIKLVDELWVSVTEDFELNGTTAVDIGEWFRVLRMRTKMPTTPLVGNVYATTGSIVPTNSDNIAAAILLKTVGTGSKNTTKTAIYTIPSDKCGLFSKIFVSSINNRIAIFGIELRPKGGDWISIADFTMETSQQFDVDYEYIAPETDIRMTSYYESGNGGITAGSLHIYLIDKDKYKA